jgi:hypothetical protein
MTDAPTLLSSARCLVCFGELSLDQALELALLQQISAMATDPQSLIAAGHCYVCYGASIFETLKLALLAEISLAKNPANDVTPQGLISQGKCLECYGMVSIPRLMELVLFTQIAS